MIIAFGPQEIGIGAKLFVERLEDVMVRTCKELGVNARAGRANEPGAWIGENKIGAVGVRISGGVASQGLSLNVCPTLSLYDHIIPCGISAKGVTSLERELGRGPSMDECFNTLIGYLKDLLGFDRVARVDGLTLQEVHERLQCPDSFFKLPSEQHVRGSDTPPS